MKNGLMIIQHHKDKHQALDELRSILTAALALTGESSETERYLMHNNMWEEKKEISIQRGIRLGKIAAKRSLQNTSVDAASNTGDITGDLETFGTAKSGEINRVNKLVGLEADHSFEEGWA